MKSKARWPEATKQRPCPICGKTSWCTVAPRGDVACCMKVPDGAYKQARNGGHLHKLDGQTALNIPAKAPERRLSDKELDAKWSPVVRRCYLNGGQRVKELAERLGVAAWALDVLQVGYGEVTGSWCWTFPERNPDGLILGINRRFSDGTKKSAPGSRRGLTYCLGWAKYDGPVFLVEGGSDVAACLTLHLSVIGRPSNVGGVPMLVEMLTGLDESRRIVVMGEHDYRLLPEDVVPPHPPACECCRRCYPGKQGALDVASQLRKRLGRRVEWRLPPGGAKDMRDYLQRLRAKEGLHPESQNNMADAGARIWQ